MVSSFPCFLFFFLFLLFSLASYQFLLTELNMNRSPRALASMSKNLDTCQIVRNWAVCACPRMFARLHGPTRQSLARFPNKQLEAYKLLVLIGCLVNKHSSSAEYCFIIRSCYIIRAGHPQGETDSPGLDLTSLWQREALLSLLTLRSYRELKPIITDLGIETKSSFRPLWWLRVEFLFPGNIILC